MINKLSDDYEFAAHYDPPYSIWKHLETGKFYKVRQTMNSGGLMKLTVEKEMDMTKFPAEEIDE
jgi:hypothetical protein